MATRRAYGIALAKLGKASKRVVALDGDTKNSTFSELFKKVFPERYIECFIAEQNMVNHFVEFWCFCFLCSPPLLDADFNCFFYFSISILTTICCNISNLLHFRAIQSCRLTKRRSQVHLLAFFCVEFACSLAYMWIYARNPISSHRTNMHVWLFGNVHTAGFNAKLQICCF